jgi:lysozyme family protein
MMDEPKTPTNDELKKSLEDLRDALNERRMATNDPAEETALLAEVKKIGQQITRIVVDDSRQAALTIGEAARSVEDLLATARLDPFDSNIQKAVQAISETAAKAAEATGGGFAPRIFMAIEKGASAPTADFTLPPASSTPASAPPVSSPPAPPSARPSAAVGALPPFVRGSTLAELAQDYTLCWGACRIDEAKRTEVEQSADRLLRGRARYEAVSARCNHVPWQLIGIMHGLECGYDFTKHLHNGDSLAAPTVREPPGRPKGWDGTGSWEDSAVDAVQQKELDKISAWSLPHILYALESFNGFGYRSREVRSPYLWSFSNLYTKGKFVADHEFDPEKISAQIGAALILKVLEERGLWP